MLLFLLLLPFLIATLYLFFPREKLSPKVAQYTALIATFGCLLQIAFLTFNFDPDTVQNSVSSFNVTCDWIPELGLQLSLWLDGVTLFWLWLVVGIGFLVFFYAGHYMDPKDSPWRFYATMLLFMGSMMGVVMSRNLLLMFFFWELTSITSFILIGHWHHKAEARAGALRALITTGTGGLCLMGGIAVIYWICRDSGLTAPDILDWDVLWSNAGIIIEHSASKYALILLLLGAFTKSAQFPFHYWLPGAMEAPTPVSAYLHAATMVKAGIYLLGRLYPIFSEHSLWLPLVGTIGVLTMLVGGFMAITAIDLKQLLAHSTVSQLGLLTAYYGFGYHQVQGDHPLRLDLLLVLSHALFKGGLFMLVGVIDHAVHTREWTRLGGLRKTMPATWFLTTIGCASMAGVPFTFGFVAKELFLKASLYLHTDNPFLLYGLPALAIFASFFTVAYCLIMCVTPFFGKPRDESLHPHEGSLGILLSPAIMIGLTLLGGLYLPLFEKPLSAVVNPNYYYLKSSFHTFALFHGLDKLFYIALLLFSVGTVVFLLKNKLSNIYAAMGSPTPFRGAYEKTFVDFIPYFGKNLSHLVQSTSLSRNILLSFLTPVVLVFAAAFVTDLSIPNPLEIEHEILTLIIPVLIAIPCLWIAITHPLTIVRLIALSPVGMIVAMFFVFFKAPDLALTQVLVELTVLVVLLLVIYRFPQKIKSRIEKKNSTLIKGIIATSVGLLMATLTYTGFHSHHRSQQITDDLPTVKDYYLGNTFHSYPADHPEVANANYPGTREDQYLHSGGGTNAVNVILVDFRGIDTFGEITVLGIAALGIFCMLSLGRDRGSKDEEWKVDANKEINDMSDYVNPDGSHYEPPARLEGESLILQEAAKVIPAMILVLGVVLFFAGHNEPGGGFIAGLLVATAFTLLLVAFNRDKVLQLYQFDFMKFIPIGILLAMATGVTSMLFGQPFLTSAHRELHLPVLGEIPIASAMGFDLGVFILVIGVVIIIVQRLGRE